MSKIILVSGGLDSFIAYKLYGGKPLFIDYGQKYARKELAACYHLFGKSNFEILEVKAPCRELENNYIPARNLFLATTAVMYFYPDKIIMAGLKDDNCADKNEAAFLEYSQILSKYAKKEVKVTSPFWEITKGQAIEMYMKLGHDLALLTKTISCYSASSIPCLDCPACFRRYIALKSNGIDTPEVSERIKNIYLKKTDKYDQDRQQRIKSILL